jgi:hypothetical protein
MTTKLKKICPEVPCYLADGIQKARAAGRMYKGRRVSHSLAFVVGAEILLDIGKEEEVLEQELNDLNIERSLIDSKERAICEQLKAVKTENRAKEEEALRKHQEIEKLAHMIVDKFVEITLFKKNEEIGYIAAAFPDKLTREKLAAIFAGGYEEDTPSYEKALEIAKGLLYPGSEEVEGSE